MPIDQLNQFNAMSTFGEIFSSVTVVLMVLIFGVFIFRIVTSAARTAQNSAAQVLTEPAKVVSKRTHVSGGNEMHVRETYYVTFELQDGQRMELSLKGEEYGLLAEGDIGELSYQGTWCKEFVRNTGARGALTENGSEQGGHI